MTIQVYDTHTLLGVLRGLDPFTPFFLNMFYPSVITFQTSKIDFDVVAEDTTLAPFVSPMVAGKAIKSQGGELRSFSPAYIKPKHVVDPERVLRRRPGEVIGGAMSPSARRDAIVADVLDLERRQILRRLEWMGVQGILNGKVLVSGEDYPEVEVDFQRDAANTIVLAGLNVWTDTVNADPLSDLEAWNDQAEAPITDFIMDSGGWKLFIAFDSVQKLLETRRGSESRVEMAPDNDKWVQYKGEIGSFRFWVYKGYYTDDNGVKQNFMPANTVVGASSAVEGVRAFGAILDGEAGYQAMEMFPKNWMNKDPAVEYLMTQSAPLMIPSRVNAAVKVTVA
ncbi:MAG: major capsid protein [Candidatus Thiodiazotropha sp. (ex Troendleina suluensis)]|nr:major capsid protein [Candidatus Thiodiazotropha sp. (ex Troendleina suluensis)]